MTYFSFTLRDDRSVLSTGPILHFVIAMQAVYNGFVLEHMPHLQDSSSHMGTHHKILTENRPLRNQVVVGSMDLIMNERPKRNMNKLERMGMGMDASQFKNTRAVQEDPFNSSIPAQDLLDLPNSNFIAFPTEPFSPSRNVASKSPTSPKSLGFKVLVSQNSTASINYPDPEYGLTVSGSQEDILPETYDNFSDVQEGLSSIPYTGVSDLAAQENPFSVIGEDQEDPFSTTFDGISVVGAQENPFTATYNRITVAYVQQGPFSTAYNSVGASLSEAQENPFFVIDNKVTVPEARENPVSSIENGVTPLQAQGDPFSTTYNGVVIPEVQEDPFTTTFNDFTTQEDPFSTTHKNGAS